MAAAYNKTSVFLFKCSLYKFVIRFYYAFMLHDIVNEFQLKGFSTFDTQG